MNRKKRLLPITFEINKDYSTSDGRFLDVIIDVLHTGLNLNDTIFEKEIVDENIDTIKNTPILGFIEAKPDMDFKGHEYVLTRTEDGIAKKYIGHAYGLIPSDCNPRWITKICDDGETREFLRVDGKLWTKFSDSIDIMERDVIKAHSMELYDDSIDGYEDEDGIFHFTKFSFDGCCILGMDSEPAMISSTVEVNYTINNFMKDIQKEIIDNYTIFTKLIDENKGGIKKMDFTQTQLELFSDISTMVSQYETMVDRWGDTVPRYYLHDIQDDEAIVVDCKQNYTFYGVPYTVEGDKPVLDFAGCKRKKTRYEDYTETETQPTVLFDFGEHISKLEETAFEKVKDAEDKLETVQAEKDNIESDYTKVKADYDSVSAKLSEIEPKYNDYVVAEKQRKEDEINAQKDAKFNEFEAVLKDVTDFTALKEKKDELTVEEIENKCAVMFYKKQAQANFSTNPNGATTTKIIEPSDNNEGVVTTSRYGNIKAVR